jgi:surface polysaccharide O-acyltransferase-like enzyme
MLGIHNKQLMHQGDHLIRASKNVGSTLIYSAIAGSFNALKNSIQTSRHLAEPQILILRAIVSPGMCRTIYGPTDDAEMHSGGHDV